jgi:hypothetical protein
MKNNDFLYKSILLSCLTALVLFGSCKKDELVSKELIVYIGGDYASVSNTVTVPLVHTPVDVSGTTVVRVAASATRAVVADVNVSIVPDTSQVSQYNQKNGTSCAALPANTYKITNPGKHKILSGSLVSDSMQLEITDPASLTNPNGYLLPLTITAIEGDDKGVQISTNKRTVYVNVTYAFNNIIQTETPLTGTPMNRTAWSVTVSNTTSGALGPAMVDGNNSTAWRSSNSSTAAKYVIVNMGSQKALTGFQLVPNYVATAENATQIAVSTSTDNVTWVAQGVWKGTGPAASSSAANPNIKGINFIAPVTAQYFRFDITALVSGSRVGIGELYAL